MFFLNAWGIVITSFSIFFAKYSVKFQNILISIKINSLQKQWRIIYFTFLFRMTNSDDYFGWLFRITVPEDYFGCLFQITISGYCSGWLFQMPISDAYFRWLFQMTVSNDYFGCLRMTISDYGSRSIFWMLVSDNFSGWLFVIPRLIRILAINPCFHGRFLFQPIVRLLVPRLIRFWTTASYCRIMALIPADSFSSVSSTLM